MSSSTRIRLLDYSRATAVLAMIFYHFVYDLGDFGYVNMITVITGSWKLFAQAIGCSFLFISGISFWIMARDGINWFGYLKRLIILTSAALLVSIATFVQFGDGFVFFGILHLLASCSILAAFIYRLPAILLLSLALILVITPDYYFSSSYYDEATFSSRYLAWTGLFNGSTGSVDFYAFMPWSAAFVLGLSVSKLFLPGTNRQNISPLSFREAKLSKFKSTFLWVGRNSLLVYLIHQPILYGALLSFQKLFA